MKIGYLAQLSPDIRNPPFDGPANHIRHIIHEWRELNHQVSFIGGINSIYWQSDDLYKFQRIENQQKNFLERSVRKIQSITHLPYLNYFESKNYSRIVSKYLANVDCLYERASWMSYGGLLASKRMNTPLLLEFNGDPLQDLRSKGQHPRGVQLVISSRLFRNTLAGATHLIASGQGWKNNLIEKWKISPQKISVVENGTILVNLLRREKLANFQEAPPNSQIKIAYLGGFYPWHGTKIAVKAFQRLICEGTNAQLIMIGDGSDLEDTKNLATSLGLEDKVVFTGALPPEKYGEILASCHIGLSPYCGWSEYSGLKLFDYKAAGLAIIASGENGQPETLVHNKTGIIVPPCDENALINAMKVLIKDREFTVTLGQQSRFEAEAKHSWGHSAQQIINIINQFVES
jgi:glycosyltransferase involved in cell wall biosynthesis